MTTLDRLVLVLNTTYEPITYCSARRALKLVLKGAAMVEDVSDVVVRTSKLDIPLPNVIRLTKYKRVPRVNRTVSRKGIMLRDANTCQYCGVKHAVGDLTIDHVVPRSRGGRNTWENMVACCYPCNNRKGSRTPDEAGMKLLKRPIQINVHAKYRLMQGDQASWDKYLFV